MASDQSRQPRDACPHCGKSTGLRWWHLLPSGNRHRRIRCGSCQGYFDVADKSRMASILGGMAGMALALFFLFAPIVKAGGGSRLAALEGTVAVVVLFGVGSVLLGWLTLRLVPKS
jgi:hypothetical protein